MNWAGASGAAVWKEAAAHAQEKEREFYALMGALGKDHRHAPIDLLEKAARSLAVVLLERGARPDPQAAPREVARRLGEVALLIARLERMSDAAYDFGLGRWGHAGLERVATVDDLSRRFEEECRGLRRDAPSTLKRVYDRFDETVGALFDQFHRLAADTKSWDLTAHHDYQGRFDPVIEGAMDAALILEAHYESQVFGPPDDSADLTRGLRPLVTGCASPPPVG